MIRFASPWHLLFLCVIPLYLWWELRHTKHRKLSLSHTRLDVLKQLSANHLPYKYLFPILRSIILTSLIVATAQPQWGSKSREGNNKGVDIVLAIDISGSMLAMDFAPDSRLAAAVKVAKDFVSRRPNDRFALVAFSEYALTQIPITFDHNAMQNSLDNLQVNEEASGTAIGMGLAKAVARLKDSKAKSRIVILITDGVNNTGEIDPLSAAGMAKQLGIKVYPIGVGSGGVVPFPYDDPLFGRSYINTLIELDMATLNKIAQVTNTGRAAMATDANSLREIMTQIDKQEKSEFKARFSYRFSERFMPFLWLAFILLLIEILLKSYFIPILPE